MPRHATSSAPVAVITGASRGLGLAMAQRLATQGCAVALLARPSDHLERAVRDLQESGWEALAVGADVRDAEALHQAVGEVRSRFGGVDLLVLNAGLCTTGRLDRLPVEAIRRDLDVSLLGAILTTRAFLPLVQRRGRLLFVSSGYGLVGVAGYSVYSAAKAGMVNFAEALRHELASRDISVHVAVPADIDTPGYRQEVEGLPQWLSLARARSTPLSAEEAARRILDRSRGGRFLVFSDPGVRWLHLMIRVLPRPLRSWLIDAMFPSP